MKTEASPVCTDTIASACNVDAPHTHARIGLSRFQFPSACTIVWVLSWSPEGEWRLAQMAGLLLPWFGPGVGLFIISPIIEMGLAESRQLTVDTQCLKSPDMNLCDSTSTFEYYFWNISNPDQVPPQRRSVPPKGLPPRPSLGLQAVFFSPPACARAYGVCSSTKTHAALRAC